MIYQRGYSTFVGMIRIFFSHLLFQLPDFSRKRW